MNLDYSSEKVDRSRCVDLTVLIPTKNRSDQLAYALRFYADYRAGYRFVVLDASNSTVKKANQRLITSLDLSIEYHAFDEIVGVNERIRKALRLCETEFVLMAGDDDFIFPDAIDKAILFLKQYPQYAACHGRAYTLAVNLTANHDEPDLTVSTYLQRSFESDDPFARFYSYVRNWTTMAYSVQRRVLMSEVFENFTMLNNDVRFMEFYWYGYLLLMGKVKRIDALYMIRQVNLGKHWTADGVDEWAETKAPLLLPVVVELLSKPFGTTSLLKKYCEMWVLSRQRFSLAMLGRYPWWYFLFKLQMKLLRYSGISMRDRGLISNIASRSCTKMVNQSESRA